MNLLELYRHAAPWAPVAVHRDAVDRLQRLYATPARSYHNVEHAVYVARTVLDLARDARLDLEQLSPTVAAALYHDCVYTPGAPDNEARSATVAADELAAAGAPDGNVAEMVRLISLTASHTTTRDDRPGQVLCDADLSTLGRSPAAYRRYVSAVRAEYPAVTAEQWARGRSAVLRAFLDRSRIFQTREGFARWELTARRNLTRELAALAAGA